MQKVQFRLAYITQMRPFLSSLVSGKGFFVWRRHAGAHPDELQHGGRKPTETSVTEFCYKSVNLLLEELINIKVTLFLILQLFR